MTTYWHESMDLAVQELMFTTTLAQLGLLPVWAYVQEHNPSGQLPYHNNYHLFHVTRLAHQLLSHYTPTHQRTLVVAGLFHDFNHSGGLCSDVTNIGNALAGFDAFVTADLIQDYDFPASAQEDVKRLIRLTEFPHVSEPTDTLGRCLRDADMLFSLSEPSTALIMDGLREELQVKEQREVSLSEMLAHQQQLFPTVTMYTPMGHLIWENQHPLALQRLAAYCQQQTSVRVDMTEAD